MAVEKGDKEFMNIMEKDAAMQVYGSQMEQCPICGDPTGRVPWHMGKNALFEHTYGMHYDCAKAAEAPQFKQFEFDYNNAERVTEMKRQAQIKADQLKAKQDGERREAEVNAAAAPEPTQAPAAPEEQTAPVDQAPASDEQKPE